MVLRFFLVLVEVTSFLLTGARLAVADLVEVLLFGVLLADALSAVGDELDWATAGDEEPSEDRKKIPEKTTTAKLRTQTQPTAESWRT